MKYHRKQLLQLLQASHRFLENPEDEEKWFAFQKALETVEAFEKVESLTDQPQILKNPTPQTRQMLRRYYEEELRPRTSILLWSSILVVVIIGVSLFGMALGRFTPLSFSNLSATPTTIITATFTQIPSVASTLTVSPTHTPTTTNTFIPISSFTLTNTRSPIVAATDGLSITLTPTETATLIPLITSGRIADSLTNDAMTRNHMFRGQMGDVITIQLDSDDFDPYLAILDSDGTEIASNDDCGSLHRACIGPIQLPDDDIYIIIVDSFTRRGIGVYTLDITVTHLPTLTTTPSSTPDCQAELPRVIIVTVANSIRLRRGPGQSYSIMGLVYNGECFTIVGRNRNNSWLQINITSGRTGWISANLGQIQGSLDSVPITNDQQ